MTEKKRYGKYDWMEEIACDDQPDWIFFTWDGESATKKRFEEAQKICDTCPVIAECREYRIGLRPRVHHGFWHGKLLESVRRNRVQSASDEAAAEV